MRSSPAAALSAASLVLALCLAALVAAARPAAGWTPRTQLAIADEAARLAPPDLYRQIDRHRARFHAGVLAQPRGGATPPAHTGARETGLEDALAREFEAAVEAIRAHQPFEEVVGRLGRIAHLVAAANDPLRAADEDPYEHYYREDYLRYLESAEPRFPLLFYGTEPRLDSSGVTALLEETLERGRRLYPLVGREYRRIEWRSGLLHFDDKSTAFGVGSLAFNYAVNDVMLVLRHVWIQAGGADTRGKLPPRGQRLYLLPRANDGAP